MIGGVFTLCIIKCTVALILFNFRITLTSLNTDVFGRSPVVRVNEVLLYCVTVLMQWWL